jgi:hypothetical protein
VRSSEAQGNSLVGRRATRVGGNLWLGDVKRLLRSNLTAAADRLWLITVTAPGQAVLPCAHATCGHKGPHSQRSAEGCRVDAGHAATWNRSAARRWREVNRQAQQNVRRRLGHPSPVVAGVWQLQARGVLHLHLLLAFDTDADRLSARAYVDELRRLCPLHGFGYVDARDRDGKNGKSTVMEAAKAAGYVSRYLGESTQFVAAIATRERPRRLVYVASRVTRSTHVTMRRLRRSRHLWSYRARLCAPPHWLRSDPVEALRVSMVLDRTAPALGP